MTNEKFTSEAQTLKKFFSIYCKDKHTDQVPFASHLKYKNFTYNIELELCQECKELIEYSFHRLQACPHDIKPKCRTCKAPCYDKSQWKKLAKLMRYGGIQLGIIKIKNFFQI
ncbi:MAG: nitrous oxide-stimulated promoter family protein [Campylobacterota bacterium]|nr:nitrous oxide-stimulated promoter family protein [Campylobacterota bacterium]